MVFTMTFLNFSSGFSDEDKTRLQSLWDQTMPELSQRVSELLAAGFEIEDVVAVVGVTGDGPPVKEAWIRKDAIRNAELLIHDYEAADILRQRPPKGCFYVVMRVDDRRAIATTAPAEQCN